jgi:CBS domain-containing protein
MKVKDIMTKNPKTCAPDTTIAAAAHLMWEGDCGILPVVGNGELIGVVTDRDMYIALATRNLPASQVPVEAVVGKTVATCEPEDDVHTALARMKQTRVRRLPVVGFGRSVVGILSINDILLATSSNTGLRSNEVVDALQAICAHQRPAAHVFAA